MRRKRKLRNFISPAVVLMMRLQRGVVVLMVIAAVFLDVCVVYESRSCPKNCKVVRNSEPSTCNTDTGACYFGCKPSYYGNACNMTCDINCERRTCYQLDGVCICSPGYTFISGSCKLDKGVKCKSNDHCLHDTCQSFGRQECFEGCKPGWYRQFCQHACPANCSCDRDSGNCTSCRRGWFGTECGSPCSPGCWNKNCDRNGTCVEGCTTGLYGDTCDLKCSAHCVSGCDQLSGECAQCEAGRHGSSCQSECSAGCAGTNDKCYRDGTCIKGCKNGYFGETCESTCPEQCDNDLCNSTTGACTIGCESGYFGSFCNLTCMNCKGGDCHRNTGKCSKNWVPYIIGGGVVFIVLVVAVLIACCKRIHNVIYVDVKWRRRSPSSASLVVSPGHVERDDEMIITPPIACLNSPERQTSYIHPRHSGGCASTLQIQPDRPDNSVVPHYYELNESLMTVPQPPAVVEASAPMLNIAVVADVHVDKEEQSKENATGGKISIPLIAECFQNLKIENLSTDEDSVPENYDHPFTDHYAQ